MAGAALGSGFAVLVDREAGSSSISNTLALYAICVPISMYVLGIWLIRDLFLLNGISRLILPGFALLILLTPLFLSLEIVAVLTIGCVLLRNRYASEAYCH
jgi:hypothetical protein